MTLRSTKRDYENILEPEHYALSRAHVQNEGWLFCAQFDISYSKRTSNFAKRMGINQSRTKLTRKDMDFLRRNTKFTDDQIRKWHKEFMV